MDASLDDSLPAHTLGLYGNGEKQMNTTQNGELSVSQGPSFHLLDGTPHRSSQHEHHSELIYIALHQVAQATRIPTPQAGVLPAQSSLSQTYPQTAFIPSKPTISNDNMTG